MGKEIHDHDKLFGIFEAVVSQGRDNREKFYPLTRGQTNRQGGGRKKEHKKYESGNKVSTIRSHMGIILDDVLP